MQKSLTWILLGGALILFATILILERNVPGTKERQQPGPVFADTDWHEVNSIQISFASGESLFVQRTNEGWALRSPNYPAQQAAVESFLTNLSSLRRLDRIASHEVVMQGARSFGLEPPKATVEVGTGTNRFRFEVGGRAPLTNNFYLRFPGSGEVILASAEAAELLPPSSLAWRDPRVVNLPAISFDQVRVRTGQRTLELARESSNRVWKITRPVPTRANQERVAGLVETLRTASVAAYIQDTPADLERFGLQIPELELTLLQGTNRVYSIEFGAPVTNNVNFVYARLLGASNVVAVPRELADFLRQPYKNFSEPQLVSLHPFAVEKIAINSTEDFVLHRDAKGLWTGTREGGPNIRIDPILLARFFTNVQAIEILDIAREVPTDADLRNFGLAEPRVAFSFYERVTNSAGQITNSLYTEISFGTNQADRIYARRSDEIPVYYTPLGQLLVLPDEAFELRDRRIWTIPATNIIRVSLMNGAGTNTLQRTPTGNWSEDPIANEAISEAVLRLSTLESVEWTSKGEGRKRPLGIRENPLTLVLETKSESYTVQFGSETMQRNIYGAVNLPGETEPVLFQFPGMLFYSLIELLPVPK